jgi:hypothetical protein
VADNHAHSKKNAAQLQPQKLKTTLQTAKPSFSGKEEGWEKDTGCVFENPEIHDEPDAYTLSEHDGDESSPLAYVMVIGDALNNPRFKYPYGYKYKK